MYTTVTTTMKQCAGPCMYMLPDIIQWRYPMLRAGRWYAGNEERRERGKRYADPREERYVKSYKEPKEIKHVSKP
ncbi:hypothetical protein K523DRAFT_90866 [Schizophyllum commune Tattone D]|nr:hypothetical protein K523DRAFT_90866 [Schizophyllum commune Tattone D]